MRKLTLPSVVLLSATGVLGAGPEAPSPPGRQLVVTGSPTLAIAQGKGEARILIDRAGAGSEEAAMSHLTLSAEARLPAHVHPAAAEIVHVLEGEGDVTASGKVHHVGPGDTLFIPAGVVHAFAPTKGPVKAVQFYVPGGPEQRFRDQGSAGTVEPGAAKSPDPGGAQVVAWATVPAKSAEGETFHILLRNADAGRKIDLLHLALPAGQPADGHGHDDVSELTYIVKGEGNVVIDGNDAPLCAGAAYFTPRGSTMGVGTKTAMEILVLVVHDPPALR